MKTIRSICVYCGSSSGRDPSYVAEGRALGRAIAGWHIEGPFLSAETGYCGAHPADKMLEPTPEHIDKLRDLAGDDPLLLTMAPEVNGGLKGFATAPRPTGDYYENLRIET